MENKINLDFMYLYPTIFDISPISNVPFEYRAALRQELNFLSHKSRQTNRYRLEKRIKEKINKLNKN